MSVGVHQTVGPCDTKAVDWSGSERRVFICAEAFDNVEDFAFPTESQALPDGTAWYSIAGVKKSDRWLYGLGGAISISVVAYGILLRGLFPGLAAASSSSNSKKDE